MSARGQHAPRMAVVRDGEAVSARELFFAARLRRGEALARTDR